MAIPRLFSPDFTSVELPLEILEQIILNSDPAIWSLCNKRIHDHLSSIWFKARWIAHLHSSFQKTGLLRIPKHPAFLTLDLLHVLDRLYPVALISWRDHLLYLSALSNQLECARFLLSRGANPNHGFAKYIQFDPVNSLATEAILEDDYHDTNAVLPYNLNPIVATIPEACLRKRACKFKYPTFKGDEDDPYLHASCPFVTAVRVGGLEMVMELIEGGADISRDVLGLLPWYCAKNGLIEVFRVLLREAERRGTRFVWW